MPVGAVPRPGSGRGPVHRCRVGARRRTGSWRGSFGGSGSGSGLSCRWGPAWEGAPGPGRRGWCGAGPGPAQLAIGEFVSSPQKARVPIAPIAEISTRLMIIDLAVARPTPTDPPVAL